MVSHSHLDAVVTDRFRRWLVNRCVRLYGCTFDKAEDIVQDCYLMFLSSNWHPSVCSEMNAMVHRLKWQFLRTVQFESQQCRDRSKTCQLSDDVHVSSENNDFEEVDSRDELEPYLGTLTDRERQVSELYLQGYTHPEIADQLGVSKQTPRQRWDNAIYKLKKANGQFA